MVDLGALQQHVYREDTRGSMKTLFKEALRQRPALVDEALKGTCRQPRPNLTVYRPVFLKESPKGRLVKPEETNLRRVVQSML
jgi:hypothetical protein